MMFLFEVMGEVIKTLHWLTWRLMGNYRARRPLSGFFGQQSVQAGAPGQSHEAEIYGNLRIGFNAETSLR
jgi:hypothetical protein